MALFYNFINALVTQKLHDVSMVLERILRLQNADLSVWEEDIRDFSLTMSPFSTLMLVSLLVFTNSFKMSRGRGASKKVSSFSIVSFEKTGNTIEHPANLLRSHRTSNSMQLNAGWGNYKSDGKKEGAILFLVVLLAVVRGAFIPKDLRTTTTCPTGYGAERTLARFKENDSSYHCLPTGELVYKYFTSRWVFPGDDDFDPNFLRIEMRGVKQGGISFSGDPVD